MQVFPTIKDNQVALVRADKNNGHVLDENFVLALEKSQRVFTVFESFDMAKGFAEETLKLHPEVEVIIYSPSQDVLFYSNK